MKRLLLALTLIVSSSAFAGLETGTYVNDLVSSNPPGSDPRSQGADHLRLVKSVLQNTFPGMAGAAERIQTKGGNYTSVKNDNTSLILYSAAATNTLTAAATVGTGYHFHVYASGGDVTLARSGADTVNGATSVVVKRGYAAHIFSDGVSAYYSFELPLTGSSVPTGSIQAFGGTSAPAGWLSADGSAVSRTTFAALFAAIGTTWGVGDGATTFNLPDLRRRVLAGSGGAGTGTLGNAVGNTGGEETHALTIAELAAHTHPGSTTSTPVRYNADNSSISGNSGTQQVYGVLNIAGDTGGAVAGTASIASQGSGTGHNVRDPSAVVLYIIKF